MALAAGIMNRQIFCKNQKKMLAFLKAKKKKMLAGTSTQDGPTMHNSTSIQ
jgi:hypothetical protein